MYVHDIMKIEIMFKLSAILLFIVNFGNYKVSADTYMVCKSVENNDHPADFASSGDAPASIRLGNVGLQGPRGLPGPIGRTGQPGPMGPPGPAGNSLNAFDDIRSELDGIKEIVVALEKGNAALKKCTGSSTPFTYILSPMNVNWQQAQDYCISIGGNLAVHGVRGEMGKRQAIADEIIRSITDHRDTTPELWIGLNDKDREGVWKWIDGEPALPEEIHWQRGEPNNYNNPRRPMPKDGEDCAYIGKGFWPEWVTNDSSCFTHRGVRGLCEIPNQCHFNKSPTKISDNMPTTTATTARQYVATESTAWYDPR